MALKGAAWPVWVGNMVVANKYMPSSTKPELPLPRVISITPAFAIGLSKETDTTERVSKVLIEQGFILTILINTTIIGNIVSVHKMFHVTKPLLYKK